MFYFSVPKGEWSVNVSCEGYQISKSTTEPNKGRVDGFIAYSDQSGIWNVGEGKNVKITNLENNSSLRAGHPELVVNDCHFNNGQVIERDSKMSFHASATTAGEFFLVGPPIQKQEKYNYTVSYGGWSDRELELGCVTVMMDEHITGSGNHLRYVTRPLRAGHSKAVTVTTIMPPKKENLLTPGDSDNLLQQLNETENSGDYRPDEPDYGNVSDTEIDYPTIGFGPNQVRMKLPDEPKKTDKDSGYLLRTRGIYSPHLETSYSDNVVPRREEDPWEAVRAFKEANPTTSSKSVASGSLFGGSLQGSLKPPPPPPRITPQEKLEIEGEMEALEPDADHRIASDPSRILEYRGGALGKKTDKYGQPKSRFSFGRR